MSENKALSLILDSFSLSNYEAVGKKTLTIPKILANIKCFVDNLP